MSSPRKLYKQVTIYFPKHERNFFMKLEKFLEQEYPDESMSWFLTMAAKDFINTKLTREQRKRFRKIGYDITGKDIPDYSETIKKLRERHGKTDQGTDS